MTLPGRWRDRLVSMRDKLRILRLAAADPRTPWYAKVLAAAVAGYALSPVDLIPDFIPLLGWLDDLILVPAGLWLAVKTIPPEVRDDCRRRAGGHLNPCVPGRRGPMKEQLLPALKDRIRTIDSLRPLSPYAEEFREWRAAVERLLAERWGESGRPVEDFRAILFTRLFLSCRAGDATFDEAYREGLREAEKLLRSLAGGEFPVDKPV
jgi:uncharacterized membrane protein YkvA (DUF1232 family)